MEAIEGSADGASGPSRWGTVFFTDPGSKEQPQEQYFED